MRPQAGWLSHHELAEAAASPLLVEASALTHSRTTRGSPACAGSRCPWQPFEQAFKHIAAPMLARQLWPADCASPAMPAAASSVVSSLSDGRIALRLKTSWSDGTTHVVYESLDLVAKLAALIPRPHKNLLRLDWDDWQK